MACSKAAKVFQREAAMIKVSRLSGSKTSSISIQVLQKMNHSKVPNFLKNFCQMRNFRAEEKLSGNASKFFGQNFGQNVQLWLDRFLGH